jgi:hypothetical protein
MNQSLEEAVFTVLEGFTLPHDVRKILETAYYRTVTAEVEKESVQELQPEPPSDENITDAWVSASDSDGIAYDGPSFERGYRLGRGEYDEYTGALISDAIKQAQQQWSGLTQEQIAQIKEDAEMIFCDTPTSTPMIVSDMIEWYDSTFTALRKKNS